MRCPECEFVFVAELEPDLAADTDSAAEPTEHAEKPGSEETDQPSPRMTAEYPDTPAGEAALHESATEESPTPWETAVLWQLRVPEGTQYGPVTKSTLDGWVEEGRVDELCEVSHEHSSWQPAVTLYPELQAAGNPFFRGGKLVAPALLPHRGYMLVGLSLLGCVIPFVSVLPVTLAKRDLDLMHRSEMDGSGRALTSASQAIGMTATFIWIGAFAVLLLMLMISTVRGF